MAPLIQRRKTHCEGWGWSVLEQDKGRERVETLRARLSDSRGVVRVVNAADLGTVLIYERESMGEAGSKFLVFEMRTRCARLYHYPDDWRQMPDAALLSLAVK